MEDDTGDSCCADSTLAGRWDSAGDVDGRPPMTLGKSKLSEWDCAADCGEGASDRAGLNNNGGPGMWCSVGAADPAGPAPAVPCRDAGSRRGGGAVGDSGFAVTHTASSGLAPGFLRVNNWLYAKAAGSGARCSINPAGCGWATSAECVIILRCECSWMGEASTMGSTLSV